MQTELRLPRKAAAVMWISGTLTAHALLPVLLARRRSRRTATPLAPRVSGVVCLVAGATGLGWSLAQHFEAAPERGFEPMTLAPEYLLRSGPYRFTRNPMYLSELVIWTGWSLLFSDLVLAGLTGLLALGLNRATRLEESALADRFGDAWQEYALRTPRWIGLAGQGRG
jgi:protein-S-isoprenylcysteine O-methyltransferase Ste14